MPNRRSTDHDRNAVHHRSAAHHNNFADAVWHFKLVIVIFRAASRTLRSYMAGITISSAFNFENTMMFHGGLEDRILPKQHVCHFELVIVILHAASMLANGFPFKHTDRFDGACSATTTCGLSRKYIVIPLTENMMVHLTVIGYN